ncbi:MmgE/PrpD family protein [Salarchaeum sp. III]|uniref:MmgE/PrpD family protein n=1 Tax=Salarchaeum sp. III TaxID=3107927 RepID=UPI002ED7B576
MTTETVHPVRAWEADVYRFLEQTTVPPAVREHGERVVADVLAAMVAGSTVDSVDAVGRTAAFSAGPATALGSGRRLDPGQAALVNATAGIAQEVEEGHNEGGHVGTSVVAGALALGETADVDGETFVDACVKAYEVVVRLEYAIFAMKAELSEATEWVIRDPHSTWTTVGPALAGALCRGLTDDALRNAFRTAANLAVVSMHDPYEEGAPSRNFTAGFSAQAGTTVPLVAEAGVTGAESGVTDVYDPLRDLLDDGEFDRLFAELGETWEIRRNYFKPYPSCRYTHPALDALVDLPEDVDAADVERVDVYTFGNAVAMNHQSPETFTSAKFSIPYVLARQLVSGAVAFEHFTSDAIAEDSVQALADRVFVHTDAEFEDRFPTEWGARVAVTVDGRTVSAVRRVPRGDHADPLSEAALSRKFERCCALALDDAERATTVLDAPASHSVATIADALSD